MVGFDNTTVLMLLAPPLTCSIRNCETYLNEECLGGGGGGSCPQGTQAPDRMLSSDPGPQISVGLPHTPGVGQ